MSANPIQRLCFQSRTVASLASIIVYSMAPDGQPSPVSTAPTPYFTPLPSGMNTPRIRDVNVSEYLAIPLGKKGTSSPTRTYLGGCRALDSLAKLIASVESFFHPTNSGSWTAEVRLGLKIDIADEVIVFYSSVLSSSALWLTSKTVSVASCCSC